MNWRIGKSRLELHPIDLLAFTVGSIFNIPFLTVFGMIPLLDIVGLTLRRLLQMLFSLGVLYVISNIIQSDIKSVIALFLQALDGALGYQILPFIALVIVLSATTWPLAENTKPVQWILGFDIRKKVV